MLLGYSLLTNQYGLTLDNVAGYELVLPNGTVTNVTSEDDDLWFGLRVSRQV
jgi:FAD/FMN-containing dehydrogenase